MYIVNLPFRLFNTAFGLIIMTAICDLIRKYMPDFVDFIVGFKAQGKSRIENVACELKAGILTLLCGLDPEFQKEVNTKKQAIQECIFDGMLMQM